MNWNFIVLKKVLIIKSLFLVGNNFHSSLLLRLLEHALDGGRPLFVSLKQFGLVIDFVIQLLLLVFQLLHKVVGVLQPCQGQSSLRPLNLEQLIIEDAPHFLDVQIFTHEDGLFLLESQRLGGVCGLDELQVHLLNHALVLRDLPVRLPLFDLHVHVVHLLQHHPRGQFDLGAQMLQLLLRDLDPVSGLVNAVEAHSLLYLTRNLEEALPHSRGQYVEAHALVFE